MHLPSKRKKDVLLPFSLAVLTSLSIWLVYKLSHYYTDIVSVPVVAESNIDGYASKSDGEVQIIARCKSTGFSFINLKMASSRKPRTVNINSKDFKQIDGTSFSISDAALARYAHAIFGNVATAETFVNKESVFHFAKESHKKVPVIPVKFISFRPQYTALEEMHLSSDSVIVYGDPARLDNIESVLTKPVTLNDVKNTRHGVVALEQPQGMRLSEKEVEYILDVVRYVEVRDRVNITKKNVPAGVRLSIYPKTVEVVLKCRFPHRGNITEQLDFYVDYDEFVSSITGRCMICPGNLPDDVIDYRIIPETCECMLENY